MRVITKLHWLFQGPSPYPLSKNKRTAENKTSNGIRDKCETFKEHYAYK